MKTMTPLSYLPIEIKSYLPSGWSLPPGADGEWDARRSVWRTAVFDGADQEWTLQVRAVQAARRGRLEALRDAMDVLYREGLG